MHCRHGNAGSRPGWGVVDQPVGQVRPMTLAEIGVGDSLKYLVCFGLCVAAILAVLAWADHGD
jgi:hypothetical protein